MSGFRLTSEISPDLLIFMTYHCLKPKQTKEADIYTEKPCPKGRLVFSLILILCFIASGLMYLWQTNTFVSTGYSLERLKKEVRRLENEKGNLMLALAELQSLKNLKEKTQALSLVEVTEVSYLSLPLKTPLVALLNNL